MSGQATVLSAGGASVASSGLYTALGIQQVQNLLNANNVVEEVYGKNGIPPIPTVPAGAAGTYVLEVPNGTNVGSLAIPAGYGAVIFGQGSSGTVTGGGPNTTVLSAGSINYSGNAGVVDDTSTVPGMTGTIVDNAAGAVFDLGGGSYSVTAGGNQQSIRLDDSAVAAIVASGSHDQVQLGDPPGSGGSPTTLEAAAVAGAASVSAVTTLKLTGQANAVTINGGNNLLMDSAGGGSNTISGVAGASTIFAGNNDVYYGGGSTTEFLSSTGAQTVFGGTGNDTVFNTQGGSILDVEGTGAKHIFVGGAGSSSIFGSGSGAVFAGAGGHLALVLGAGNDVFVGLGGADSIYGGNVTPTVFGANNEHASIIGSGNAFEVALGANSSYDASLSNGGNNFFATSTTGNTTLVGAFAAKADTFNLINNGGSGDHTITVQNWHTGDGLFLGNYSQTDIQTMDTAIGGGASSFKLSDGTTVVFQGAHPTNASGHAIW